MDAKKDLLSYICVMRGPKPGSDEKPEKILLLATDCGEGMMISHWATTRLAAPNAKVVDLFERYVSPETLAHLRRDLATIAQMLASGLPAIWIAPGGLRGAGGVPLVLEKQ